MFKLMKYEFRKSLFSKLIFVGITGVMELIYLFGIFTKRDNPTLLGMIGLFFTALAGIAFMGIESILTLNRDLTTKQSYMLFMTPNTSYKILGAKALENGVAILLSGAFFGGLAVLDFWLLGIRFGAAADFIEMFTSMLEAIDPRLVISTRVLLTLLFTVLFSWVLQIVTGYLAVVLANTLLAGKRGASVIAFIIYVAISLATSWIFNQMPQLKDTVATMQIQTAVALVFSVIMYFVTAWIMDKKLSV